MIHHGNTIGDFSPTRPPVHLTQRRETQKFLPSRSTEDTGGQMLLRANGEGEKAPKNSRQCICTLSGVTARISSSINRRLAPSLPIKSCPTCNLRSSRFRRWFCRALQTLQICRPCPRSLLRAPLRNRCDSPANLIVRCFPLFSFYCSAVLRNQYLGATLRVGLSAPMP